MNCGGLNHIHFMKILWKPYVWKQPRPVAPEELQALESQWGVKLPEDYKQLVSVHQGMTPQPGVFHVGRGANVLGVLLTITRDEESELYSVQHTYDVIRPHVPPGVYPFGDTPGGEQLCFDYRNSPDQPTILLVTVEMSLYPVANNFSQFLQGLHDG